MGGPLPTILTFVLPYKRFAAPDLLARAKTYLNESRATYRSVVRHKRCLIGYPLQSQDSPVADSPVADNQVANNQVADNQVADNQDVDNQDVDAQVSPGTHQPVVPPSLVWRFLTWMGSLTYSLDKAREMILKHQPNSLCHRVSGSVDPFKARSEDRQRTLETARQLVLIMPEWEDCFGQEFFPRFATRAGFD